MPPRLPYGSNCAANWGLLYDTFGKERITIYGLDATPMASSRRRRGRCSGSTSTGCPTYTVPGFVTPPDASPRGRSVGRSRSRCARTSA